MTKNSVVLSQLILVVSALEAHSRAKQAGVGTISTASSVPFSAPVSWSTESTTSAGYTATASTDSTSPATATEPTS